MRKNTMIAVTTAAIATASATVTATASAYSFDPPSTSFTATNTGPHTTSTSGIVWSCTSATATGTTGASGATVRLRPAYSGCTLTTAGLTFPTTITVASDWDLTITGGTGPWTATRQILAPPSGHAFTISVPSLGCAIFVDAQTTSSGITITNTTPTGLRISANMPNIAYTQNGGCPIPATGTMTYAGVWDIAGLTLTN